VGPAEHRVAEAPLDPGHRAVVDDPALAWHDHVVGRDQGTIHVLFDQ
jgi:hypothetical protein